MTPVITGTSRGSESELEAAYLRMVERKAEKIQAPICPCGSEKKRTQRGTSEPYWYCRECASRRMKELAKTRLYREGNGRRRAKRKRKS